MATIKKITLRSGAVRYRSVVDAGRKPDGSRNQVTITKDTKTEVKNEIARIQNERANGTYVAPSRMTVAEWAEQWLAKKAEDLEETTIPGYRGSVSHITETMGHIPLQELTEDHVEEFVQWLLTGARRRGNLRVSGLRPETVDTILRRLKEMLGRAYVRKLVRANVAEYVHVPRKARKQDRRENPKVRPWSVSEVQTFIRGIESDRMYAPLLLSLMGLRPAEVCGLRWEDVDLEAGTLSVLNTRTMVGNQRTVEKDTKSEAGERMLPLPKWVWEALKKFRARQAAEKLAAGEAYAGSGYVLVDVLGQAMTTRQLRAEAYACMERLRLRRVRLYDARHSCLKYLAVSGVEDVVLAAWAGHTNAAFTKARYVRPDVEDLRSAAVAWDGLHGAQTDGS